MDLILILAPLSLLGTAVWLWRLSKPQMLDLSLFMYPPIERALAPVEPVRPVEVPAHERLPRIEAEPTMILQTEPAHFAWFVARSGSRAGKAFQLREETNIGRDGARNDIVVDDLTVSRQHATIRFENGRFVLYDLASASGTFVNGRRIQKLTLLDGDTIQMGEAVFVFLEVRLEKGEGAKKTGRRSGSIGITTKAAPPNTVQRKGSHGAVSKPQRRDASLAFEGEATLPRQVYVGDSHPISVVLRPTSRISTTRREQPHVRDTRHGKLIVMDIDWDAGLEQFLEIELLAAGLEIAGEEKQRQPLNSPRLTYWWNCYFPNSGWHWLSLVLRLVSQSETMELGVVPHNINVAKLDGLTQRQVWLMASLAGILSGGLAIVEALRQLGVW